MLRSIEMKDYMSTNPVRLKAEDDIFDAIAELLKHQASGACVVDNGGHLIGVLSELDCLRAILGSVYNKNPSVGVVQDFMTKEVISVKITDNIVDVARDMLEKKHRRRPVIQDNGLLIGQVTCRQLLNAVSDFAGT